MFLFFFKQKTAYVMRISDWSSDVCSSDLVGARRDAAVEPRLGQAHAFARIGGGGLRDGQQVAIGAIGRPGVGQVGQQRQPHGTRRRFGRQRPTPFGFGRIGEAAEQVQLETGDPAAQRKVGAAASRSEEHTSELQSLMRISYAVFCLKKKNTHIYTNE